MAPPERALRGSGLNYNSVKARTSRFKNPVTRSANIVGAIVTSHVRGP